MTDEDLTDLLLGKVRPDRQDECGRGDHPQVGGGILDQPDAVEDVAAVDAVHHQHDGEQHAHADDGGDELADVAADVP